MKYVGLSRYTDESVEKLLEVEPEGVVLGDLLCNRKMFPYCGNELVEIMQTFKKKGISVIYQTPMYITDRVFSEILQKIVYFYENKLIDAVIVQDIGLASTIHAKFNDITMIWGRMGYARTPIVNISTLLFYMRHGVNAFECRNAEQAKCAKKIGASSYLVYGYPKYLTINRECYYRFEHNLFEEDCGLGCLKREKIRIPAKQIIDSTIDGYVLGWEHVYDEKCIRNTEICDNYIVYADSFSGIKKRYHELV